MILRGLVSIHGHGYVHCDLKSNNLLVFPSGDSSYELKISDFGNSIEAGEIPDYWEIDYPFVGTPNYMPPESFHDGVAEKTLDLWSLGCIVLEMYAGERPWPGLLTKDLVPLLFDGNAPGIPESVPWDARGFIETCLARNPDERGSASKLLSHRFLRREGEKTEKMMETRNSWLLKLMWRMRRGSKKSMDIPEKALKSKMFPSKPPQFKKFLNKFLRFKISI